MVESKNPNEMPERPAGGAANYARQMAIAMELPFALAGPVLVGGVIGFFLDKWWGTAPFMLLIMGGLGFFAGVRELMRRMKSLSQPVTKPAATPQNPPANLEDGDGKTS